MKRWSDLHGDVQDRLTPVTLSAIVIAQLSRAKFLVGQVKCEPVPAYIGGARTATCGRARVVPREVVSQ